MVNSLFCSLLGRVLSKLEPFNTHLRTRFSEFFKCSSHIVVDECMVRFTGRSSDTTTIHTKPGPTGYKVWAIACEGYILAWMWHSRGAKYGPVDLNKIKGLNKTQCIAPQLILWLPHTPLPYIVWLDNLFPSIPLFTYLRGIGIGATGTASAKSGINEDLDCNSF